MCVHVLVLRYGTIVTHRVNLTTTCQTKKKKKKGWTEATVENKDEEEKEKDWRDWTVLKSRDGYWSTTYEVC